MLMSSPIFSFLFWGISPHAKRIFILQKRALRAMYGLKYNDHCTELFKHHKFLTVPSIFILNCAMFLGEHPDHFIINNSTNGRNFTRRNADVHVVGDYHLIT
jgi:hypothetical protein